MKRCVIIGGSEIRNYAALRPYLGKDDFYLFCDSGLAHREGLGVSPDLAVGDFDSHPRPEEGEVLVLPAEKDDTDTMFAAREAVRRGFRSFLLLGAAGGRLDHTLGNLGVLQWLYARGCRAVLADDFSEMELVGAGGAEIGDEFPFFSLLNISGLARGVTVTGAKYPLKDAEIPCDWPYGVSNEPLPGRTARVTVSEGRLLLIRVRIRA